jgi:hypothetical protein
MVLTFDEQPATGRQPAHQEVRHAFASGDCLPLSFSDSFCVLGISHLSGPLAYYSTPVLHSCIQSNTCSQEAEGIHCFRLASLDPHCGQAERDGATRNRTEDQEERARDGEAVLEEGEGAHGQNEGARQSDGVDVSNERGNRNSDLRKQSSRKSGDLAACDAVGQGGEEAGEAMALLAQARFPCQDQAVGRSADIAVTSQDNGSRLQERSSDRVTRQRQCGGS